MVLVSRGRLLIVAFAVGDIRRHLRDVLGVGPEIAAAAVFRVGAGRIKDAAGHGGPFGGRLKRAGATRVPTPSRWAGGIFGFVERRGVGNPRSLDLRKGRELV